MAKPTNVDSNFLSYRAPLFRSNFAQNRGSDYLGTVQRNLFIIDAYLVPAGSRDGQGET